MKNLFMMTIFAVFPLISYGENPSSKAQNNGTSTNVCSDYAKQVKKANNYELSDASLMSSNNKMFQGSSPFEKCDNLSMGTMKDLYKNGRRTEFSPWTPNINYFCCSKKTEEEQVKCKNEYAAHAARCESVAFLIDSFDRDWGNEEINKPSKSESSARMPAQGADAASAMKAMASAGAIKCSSAGMETLDFDGCKKFVSQLELIETFQVVGNQTQEVVYKGKIIDSQIDYMNEKNSATGALKAQRDSFSMQKDMYNQRTAVDTVKLGYLYSIFKDIPDSNEIASRCNRFKAPPILNRNVTPEDCKAALRGGFELVKNQSQLDAMKRKLIAIATEAGSNTILASLMGKSADNIDNAINKIDSYKAVDPFVVAEEEAQTSFCKMNPGQPQCLPAGLESNLDSIDGNVITFGGGATGTSYAGPNLIQDTGTTGGSAIGSNARIGVTPVGSVIASAVKDNSMENSKEASITSKGNGSSGGGGGGGGGSGAGGGGSGGGGGSSGGAGAAQDSPGGNVAAGGPKYTDASGFSVVGGFGINNRQKKEGGSDENPFGKLFGKDTPKGTAVVNFREVASQKVGDKSENIFDMISTRYKSVAADKRLIEYELTK